MMNEVGVLDAAPSIAPAYESLYAALWSQTHIPPAILELCRLRLAQLHNSPVKSEREFGAPSALKRELLREWHVQAAFSAEEKACLAFTEVYAMDAQGVSDELADAVKLHYGESGLVLLIEALGILDAKIRIDLLWQTLGDLAGERK